MPTSVEMITKGHQVIFFGHSYLTGSGANSIAGITMIPYPVPWRTFGVGGSTASQQLGWQSQMTGGFPAVTPIATFILITGVNDLILGRTGADTTTDMTAILNAATAAGYDYTLVSTIPASTSVSGGQETQRGLANSTILAMAGGTRYVIDIAGAAGATANSTALAANIAAGDGTHPSSNVGRQAIADMHAPTLTTILV